MVDEIIPEAALHAQPLLIGRTRCPIDILDSIILDLKGDLASDAAKRTDAANFLVEIGTVAPFMLIHHRSGHEGAGWAGLDALSTGDAGRLAHRVGEIKHDLSIMPPSRHANHVIDLDLAARPYAKAAMNAGVQVDTHCRVGSIKFGNAFILQSRQSRG